MFHPCLIFGRMFRIVLYHTVQHRGRNIVNPAFTGDVTPSRPKFKRTSIPKDTLPVQKNIRKDLSLFRSKIGSKSSTVHQMNVINQIIHER